MNITDIQGKSVRLSKGTITVKDAFGKTRGIVRGLVRFEDMPLRDQTEVRKLAFAVPHQNKDRLYFERVSGGWNAYYIYKKICRCFVKRIRPCDNGGECSAECMIYEEYTKQKELLAGIQSAGVTLIEVKGF